jgi:hypothetical protein
MSAEPAGRNPAGRQKTEAALNKLNDEAKRYNNEKKDIEKAAKELEAERDLNQRKDPYFDYAEVMLQIAIVLASIAIISASPGMYYFSIATAALGAVLSFNGFFLWFKLPFFP